MYVYFRVSQLDLTDLKPLPTIILVTMRFDYSRSYPMHIYIDILI